jgi:hypothetical protein
LLFASALAFSIAVAKFASTLFREMLRRRKSAHRNRRTVWCPWRFGQRYADMIGTTEDGRLGIDYGEFHETLKDRMAHPCHADNDDKAPRRA